MTRLLIDANIGFLQQAGTLLESIDAVHYAGTPIPGLSSAGAHLRHILDHYASFVNGVSEATVNYDHRQRDRTIEQDPVAAGAVVRDLISRLRALPETVTADRSLQVTMDCGPGVGPTGTVSSVRRELQFLVSHTVHHFALMKAVLTISGVTVPDNFGVAPSTLTHRANTACAP